MLSEEPIKMVAFDDVEFAIKHEPPDSVFC